MLDYPLLSDTDKATAKKFGVVHERRSLPERWTFYMYKGKVVKVQKKVNVRKHGEEIVKTLKELGAK